VQVVQSVQPQRLTKQLFCRNKLGTTPNKKRAGNNNND